MGIDIAKLLEGKIVLQSQFMTPQEGNRVQMTMPIHGKSSLFVMLEIADAPEDRNPPPVIRDVRVSVAPRPAESNIVRHARCKRVGAEADEHGKPWPHVHDPTTQVCIFCGDGARVPPPEAYEPPRTANIFETISCSVHGTHRIEIRPDGSYDKPDCEMFGKS